MASTPGPSASPLLLLQFVATELCEQELVEVVMSGKCPRSSPLPMLLPPVLLGLTEKFDPKVSVLLPRSEGETVEFVLEEGEGAGRCSAATFNLVLAEGGGSPALIASRLVSTDTNEYHMLYTALRKTKGFQTWFM